jgi:hypothetical protein
MTRKFTHPVSGGSSPKPPENSSLLMVSKRKTMPAKSNIFAV